MSLFRKTTVGVLDYTFDWTAWLAPSETIASHVLTVPAGITLTLETVTTKAITGWFSGGTAETTYEIACKVITNQGRTDERVIDIEVVTSAERST
jgi:hypothetical protein